MRSIVDQPSYVVLRHLWQLLLVDAFEACEDDGTLAGAVVINDAELDLAVAFFDDRRLEANR